MLASYEMSFIVSLIITLIIELPVAFLLLENILKIRKKSWDVLLTGSVASCLTLPYLWFIISSFVNTAISYIIFGETFAILVESLIYAKFLKIGIKNALILSAIANISSFIVGWFLFW